MKTKNKGIFIIMTLSLILSAASFPFMDASIPIHWDFSGQPDSYGSRYMIFLVPVLIFVLWFAMDFFRKIDPKKAVYSMFEESYAHMKFAICLLLLAVQILTIAVCFGVHIQMDVVIPLIVGLLFTFLGNIMPKFKHNYFVGIRTPWTLNNADVWFKTHRFAGKLWFAGGILMAFSSFLTGIIKLVVFFSIVCMIVIIPYVYSYRISQH
jgi:uncharacterized membrane protein